MSSVIALLSRRVVQRLGWALVHSLWQAAAVAALLVVVLLILRNRSPGARYLAACLALAAMLAAPVATYFLWLSPPASAASAGPPLELPEFSQQARAPLGVAPPVAPAPARAPRSGAAVSVPGASWRTPWTDRALPLIQRILPWLVALWLAGVVILSVRLLLDFLRVQRIRRRGARPVGAPLGETARRLAQRLGLRKAVALFESACAEVPIAIGWLRPVILLPASLVTRLPPAQLEAILAHELAHVRRHDYLVNLFQTVAETLMFYHPAVHWASRRIRQERELCCDDLAVACCGDPVVYARALAELAQAAPAPSPAAAASGGSLLPRIRRLLGVKEQRDRLAMRWLAGLAPAAILIAVLGGCLVVALPKRAAKVGGAAPPGGQNAPSYTEMLSFYQEGGQYRMPTPEEIRMLGPLWPKTPPEQNAVYYFVHIDALLHLWNVADFESVPRGSAFELYGEGDRSYNGDEAALAAWVHRNQLLYDWVGRAIRARTLQYPMYIERDSGLPFYGVGGAPVRNAANLCRDAAFLDELRGNADSAASWYLEALAATSKGEDTCPEGLFAIAPRVHTAEDVSRLIANFPLSQETLSKIIAACRAGECAEGQLTGDAANDLAVDSFVEARGLWGAYEKFLLAPFYSLGPAASPAPVGHPGRPKAAAGPPPEGESSAGGPAGDIKGPLDRGLYFAKMTAYANARRQTLSGPLPELITHAAGIEAELQHAVRDYPLLEDSVPAVPFVLRSLGRANVALDAAEIRAAIALYQGRHDGQLPESLDALCPGILPEVPIDPFSGKPMRYARTPYGWKVWSVGADGVDNGGVSDATPEELSRGGESNPWKGPDYVFVSDLASNLEVRSGGKLRSLPVEKPGDNAVSPSNSPVGGQADVTYRDGTLNEVHDFSISGIVRGEDGKPIAGATVHADKFRGDRTSQLTVTTGADGAYRFEKLAEGIWRVWAEAAGLTRTYPYEHSVILPALEPSKIDLVLFRPRTLTVRVKDETGASVAGAQVIVAREFYDDSYSHTPQGNLGSNLAEARTNAQGEATLTGLRPYRVMLVIYHPDYAAYVSDMIKIESGPVTPTLSKGGAIFGRVEADGKPLAGVTVKVECGALSQRDMRGGESVTDAEGRFRVGRLYLGPKEMGYWDTVAGVDSKDWVSDEYWRRLSPQQSQRELVIQAKRRTPGFQPERIGFPEPEALKPPAPQPAGHAEVSGVAYGADDQPVPGVAVSLSRQPNPDAAETAPAAYSATVHADAQGRFAFSGVPAGTYTVTGPLFVTDTSHMEGPELVQVTDKHQMPLLAPVKFVLADGEKKSVDLRSGHSVISGTVLGIPPGAPVTIAVQLTSRDPDSLWSQVANWVAATDVDLATGRFDFPAAGKGNYEVEIEPYPRVRDNLDVRNVLANLFVSKRERANVDGQNPAELRVEFGHGRIEGVLLTPEGEPLHGMAAAMGSVGFPGVGFIRPDKDGRFSISWISPGEYELFAQDPCGLPVRQKVLVPKDGTVPVSIRLGGGYGSLALKVSRDGMPVQKASATFVVPPAALAEHPEWSVPFSAFGETPGLLTAPALPPVPVQVIIACEKDGNVLEQQIKVLPRVQIEPGKTAQTAADFANQAAVAFSCVTEAGLGVYYDNTRGLQLRIVRIGEYTLDGRNVLSNLAAATLDLDPGQYRFEGEAPGFIKASTEFTVQPNGAPQKATLVFRKAPGN